MYYILSNIFDQEMRDGTRKQQYQDVIVLGLLGVVLIGMSVIIGYFTR